jgi:hypothetical protein
VHEETRSPWFMKYTEYCKKKNVEEMDTLQVEVGK